jgi:hypothetical protein
MSAPSGATGRVVHHGSQVVPVGTIGPEDTALRAQAVEMDAALPGREPVAEQGEDRRGADRVDQRPAPVRRRGVARVR